jgi:hypothetical protein
MTSLDRLDRLGAALHAAATADVGRGARRRRRRTLAAGLAALAIAVPGAALAANALISTDDVAKSIPSGTWALMGTQPTCTTVRPGVEFDCTLAKPPRTGDVEPGGWYRAAEPTVDRTKHVNGGCRSLSADGMRWRCYIGREAVRQQIIGPGFLGELAPAPGRG